MKSKKILVVFVFLILLSILFSVKVFAVEEYIDRTTGFHFKIVGNEITITGAEDYVKVVDIPSTIDGKNVTTIGSFAFDGRNDILQITIPETVENIEIFAFRGCENITEIKLPNGLVSLGSGVFYNCKSLKEIEIPCNLISGSTFDGCTKLEKVTFTNNVTTIGAGAYFDNCVSLKEIYIPSSVTSVGFMAFNLVNSNFTIYGDYNSYIRQYCEENGINFVATSGQPQEEQKPNEEEQKPNGEQKPNEEEQKPNGEQKPNEEEQKPSAEQKPQGQQNQEQKPTENNNKNSDKTIATTKLPKARFNKYYNTNNNICINIKYNFL